MDPYKFEDNLQNVCFTGLTARGIPHGTTRANALNTQERVEVTSSGWARASGQMAQSASGAWFDSHYTGVLAFGVITQIAGDNAPNHNVWVSNIRSMLSRPTQFFTANTLPCYEILRVVETNSDPAENIPTDCHHTAITYAIDLAILGSAIA